MVSFLMFSAIRSDRKRESTARPWKKRSFSSELQYNEGGGETVARHSKSLSNVLGRYVGQTDLWFIELNVPDQTSTNLSSTTSNRYREQKEVLQWCSRG